VERQSSPADDDDAGLCSRGQRQWPGLGLSLLAKGDEVQKQVAEVAKALYQRTDGLVVLRARAITRPVVAEALPQIACTLRSVDVYSAWMADP